MDTSDIQSASYWTERLLTVADVMGRGVMLDLFESFEISLSRYEPPNSLKFDYSCLQFFCRTTYSFAFGLIAYGTFQNIQEWRKSRKG